MIYRLTRWDQIDKLFEILYLIHTMAKLIDDVQQSLWQLSFENLNWLTDQSNDWRNQDEKAVNDDFHDDGSCHFEVVFYYSKMRNSRKVLRWRWRSTWQISIQGNGNDFGKKSVSSTKESLVSTRWLSYQKTFQLNVPCPILYHVPWLD